MLGAGRSLLGHAEHALDASGHASRDTADDATDCTANRPRGIATDASTLLCAARHALSAGAQGKREDCQCCCTGQSDMLDCHDEYPFVSDRSASLRALGCSNNRTGERPALFPLGRCYGRSGSPARIWLGAEPMTRLKARLKAASDS